DLDGRLHLAADVAADGGAGCAGEDGLIDNALGGGEVLLHQERRHGEDVADVVEAVADVVGGEVVGGLEIDGQEVADGVVVLGAVEAADGDAAGIAALGAINGGKTLVEEGEQQVA